MPLKKTYFIFLLLPVVILRSQAPSHQKRPILGFARQNGASPVTDSDSEAEKQNFPPDALPGDSAKNTRKVHEAVLFEEFLDGLKESKDCSGISVSAKAGKLPPDFLVLLRVSGHDNHPDNQSWFWIVRRPGVQLREGMPSVGLGGMGSAANAKLAARDVCRTIWEDLDPNRLKKPARGP